MLFPAEGASGAGAAGAGASGSAAGATGAAGGAGSGSGAAAGTGEGAGGQQSQQRDWAKDYGDLDGRFKQRDELAKKYESFGTPEQIQNAIAWANEGIRLRKAIEEGTYVPKTAAEKRQAAEHGIDADPYAGWDDLTEAQRDEVRYKNFLEKARKELGEPLNQQVAQRTQQSANEMQLMFKLMRHLAKNPDLDVETVMAEAIAEANQPGSKLVDMVIDRKLQPKLQEQAIKDAVEKALEQERAAVKQREENERIAQFQGRSTPLIKHEKKERGNALRSVETRFMKLADELSRKAS